MSLPPERLSLPGFGWAPTTWASRDREQYPYSLSGTDQRTEIHPEGLLIHYPGIILHSENLRTILKCLAKIRDPAKIEFPVCHDLHEWYEFFITDEGNQPKEGGIEKNRLRQKQPHILALILSRPRPKGHTPEIGLSVEIYDSRSTRQQIRGKDETTYYSRIISRIKISRTERNPSLDDEDQVIGELMVEDQL